MEIEQFRKYAHELVDWMADYLDNVEQYPVLPDVKPGEISSQIPEIPPEEGEAFEIIFDDFRRIVVPGMTHWQSPNFFAYFPANSSPPSLLAEMLTATLGAQCMIWQTSPAATELEEKVMQWLAKMLGLPPEFTGVIQDTASTATLCSLLTVRESRADYKVNQKGFPSLEKRFRVYCSEETHSSIDKAVRIAGIGQENLCKIPVDNEYAIIPEKLEEQIRTDLDEGYIPLWAVATLGTTGSTAVDPLESIGKICREHGVWLHVDAAFAGTAMLLPEFRWMNKGMEYVDSFVFNPHKWMFTNFDCSAYFVRRPDLLIRTFEILPEYLKTKESERVNNYRDWGIQLGRRFRALKLWFVIRTFGIKGLREKLREHLELARWFEERIKTSGDFELLAPVKFTLICFRYHPADINDDEELNELNRKLLERLNSSGRIFISHTKLSGKYTLRIVVGQTYVKRKHVKQAWELIQQTARKMKMDKQYSNG